MMNIGEYKISVMADPDPVDPRAKTQMISVHLADTPQAKWGFPITVEEYLSEGKAYQEFDANYYHLKVYQYPEGYSKAISIVFLPFASSLTGVAFSRKKYWRGDSASRLAYVNMKELVKQLSCYIKKEVYGYTVSRQDADQSSPPLASEWGFYDEDEARQDALNFGLEQAKSKHKETNPEGWNTSTLPKDTTQLYLLSINGGYELAYWNDAGQYWDSPYGSAMLNSEIDGWRTLPDHP